jgi:hypothetical protein
MPSTKLKKKKKKFLIEEVPPNTLQISTEVFTLLEIQLNNQKKEKLVLEGEFRWVTSSHLGQWHRPHY